MCGGGGGDGPFLPYEDIFEGLPPFSKKNCTGADGCGVTEKYLFLVSCMMYVTGITGVTGIRGVTGVMGVTAVTGITGITGVADVTGVTLTQKPSCSYHIDNVNIHRQDEIHYLPINV